MRTTITLDPDVDALVQKFMRERDLSFKQAVNAALRAGLSSRRHPRYIAPSFDLGQPRISLEHALRLAADLADEEAVGKMSVGR